MILYVFIYLFIQFAYIMCHSCQVSSKVSSKPCKTFPVDDIEIDLQIPVETNDTNCGTYGFRCLNKHVFEICELPQDRHSSDIFDPLLRRECANGYVCDEENPAYCSPVEANAKIRPNDTCHNADLDDDDYINDPENTNNFEEYLEEDTSLKRSTSPKDTESVDCEAPIVVSTTTEVPHIETTTIATCLPTMVSTLVNFNCEYSGFYADYFNKSTFWICDPKPCGEGYIATHMACKNDQIFSKRFHACVIPEINLEIRNSQHKNRCTTTSFSCTGKSSGKYADKENCHYYHVCVNSKFSPIKELLFVCPEATAYDPCQQKCSKDAIERCATDCIPPNKTNFCQGTASRFRQTSDCKSYYICTEKSEREIKIKCPKGYRVDDNVMDCLPKRIAQCTATD